MSRDIGLVIEAISEKRSDRGHGKACGHPFIAAVLSEGKARERTSGGPLIEHFDRRRCETAEHWLDYAMNFGLVRNVLHYDHSSADRFSLVGRDARKLNGIIDILSSVSFPARDEAGAVGQML